MVKIETSTGFKCEIDERVLNDWRFVCAVADSSADDERSKLTGTRSLVKMLLGSCEEDLINHVAEKNDGLAPTEAIMFEVTEILHACKDSKK